MAAQSYCYWVFDETCICPRLHGYVGITQRIPGRIANHYRRFGPKQYAVLLTGSRDECAALEAELRPHHNIGWNVAQGGRQTKGHLGRKHSDEAKAIMRERKLGRTHTPEARAKMRRPMSEETKAKLRAIHTGSKRTTEQRARMSAAQMGNKKNLGKQCAEETKRKIGQKSRGRQFTPESIEKMRKSHMGQRHCLGYRHTAEARANMSAAHKGKTMPFEVRAKISAALVGKPKVRREPSRERRMSWPKESPA